MNWNDEINKLAENNARLTNETIEAAKHIMPMQKQIKLNQIIAEAEIKAKQYKEDYIRAECRKHHIETEDKNTEILRKIVSKMG